MAIAGYHFRPFKEFNPPRDGWCVSQESYGRDSPALLALYTPYGEGAV
jgi:hypothetical protein